MNLFSVKRFRVVAVESSTDEPRFLTTQYELEHTFSHSQTPLQTIVCVHTLACEDVFTKVLAVSSSIQSLY